MTPKGQGLGGIIRVLILINDIDWDDGDMPMKEGW